MNSKNLFDYVKRKVDLSEFLETEIACTLKWYEPNVSAGCLCPFPDHNEKVGSFRIKLTDGIWIFHCFGCDRSGTIINFCQMYYALESPFDALAFLCKKFGFEKVSQFELDSLGAVDKKFDVKKKMECAHVEVASQCRRLLKKNYHKYGQWVSSAYKTLNKALDDNDIDLVEKIGFEACNKIGEK